jgi:uncharacterized membrane protein YecN with MAPEG domain
MSTSIPEMTGHPVGDRAARQRFIARSIWFTVPGTFAVLFTAYTLLPPLDGMAEAHQRLLLALKWLLIALLPYVGVCLVIATVRFFEGSHNPLAQAESEWTKIHCRVMQNTLEQFIWLAFCILPLATLLKPDEVRLVPVACVFFAFARLAYWWGYLRNGTLGRAPGVQMTFTLNLALLVHTLTLFARQLLA